MVLILFYMSNPFKSTRFQGVIFTPRGTIPKKKGEIWKLIEGTEDFFISNFGRFRHKKKLMKQSLNSNGYLTVNIGRKRCTVHRLVALAFIPNPNNYPVVDHIDGNKKNNNSLNLRWTTISENTKAAYRLKLAKRWERLDILALDDQHNGILYESQVAAAKGTGVTTRTVQRILHGHLKQHKGWRFIKVRSITDCRTNVNEQNNREEVKEENT